MKKRIFILMLAAALLFPPVQPVKAQAPDAGGAWVLDRAEDHEAADYISPYDDPDYSGSVDYSYARAAYVMEYRTQWREDDIDYTSSGTVSAAFSGLPQIIKPGETVTVSARLGSSASTDYPDTSDYTDEYPPSAWIKLAGIAQTAGSYENVYEISSAYFGEVIDRTETVSFTLPAGGDLSYEAEMWVEFGLSNPADMQYMSTVYYYKWTGAKQQREIILSGVVTGSDNNRLRPLPRIKTDVYVYYDIGRIPADWGSGAPDLTLPGAADLGGAFSFRIPVPAGASSVIGVILKVTMRCVLPQNRSAFFLADYQDANALNEIRASTLISVDPNDSRYGNADSINISRGVQFHNLPLGFLTFDDSGDPEAMQTNLGDTMKFLGYGYMYRLLWDALTVGGVVFDELPALLPAAGANPLRVDCGYVKRLASDSDVSHYSSYDNAIRLTEDCCLFDDNSRFTVLHEFGHFFEAATNGFQARCGWQNKISAGDRNHGGYLNNDTADSFVEGFATWYACVVQIYRKDHDPYQTGSWNIKEPATWKAWDLGGINEELSVASVFANAMFFYDDVKGFWQNILRPDRANFYEYYAAMLSDLGGDTAKIKKLNGWAADAGLYRMPFGNGQYDPGEPFRDTDGDKQWSSSGESFTDSDGNGRYDGPEQYADADSDGRFDAADEPFTDSNGDGQYDFGEAYSDLDSDGHYDFAETLFDANGDGVWDPGESFTDANANGVYDGSEPYGDLMFTYDAASGSIDTTKTLRPFDPKNAALGESAANNYPVRRSTYLHPNSFISVGGEPVSALRVTVKLRGRDAYAYTAYPAGGRIYIGLPAGAGGSVEIAVPGGGTVYEGDASDLAEKLVRTMNTAEPLDYAEIPYSALAPAGVTAGPTGGDPAGGVFVPDPWDNAAAGEAAVNFDPDAGIGSLYVTDFGGDISRTGTSSVFENRGALAAGAGAFLFLIIFIAVLRRRKKTRPAQAAYYSPPPAQTRPPEQTRPSAQARYAEQYRPAQTRPPSEQPPPVYKKSFCRHCGAKLSGTRFCENCGHRVE